MKFRIKLLLLSILAISLTACGSGKAGSGSGNAVSASKACLDCHASSVTPGSGALVVAEWQSSTHFARNVAGCVDCHEPAGGTQGHPCSTCHGGGSLNGVIKNPDAAGKCYKCHDQGMSWPLGETHYPRPVTANPNAFGRFDGSETAAYVIYRGTPDASNCTFCHNPHDNKLTEQHEDWAESGHGEVTAAPWNYYDFKAYTQKGASPANSAANDCVRCHTTTGYLRYVSSGFSNIDPWGVDAKGVSQRNEKQVLYCNACHDNGDGRAYGWQRRSVGQVTGYYNFSSTQNNPAPTILYSVKFPDLNTSNICLACHTGRIAGNTIKLAKEAGANFASMSFMNSHYLSAGATIFKAAGYEFYTSAAKYSNSGSYNHDQIGQDGAFGAGVDGPCVTCHLKPGRHTFLPVVFVDKSVAPLLRTITKIVSPTCNTSACHDNSASPRVTTGSLQAKKDGFSAALDALQAQMVPRGILYSGSAYPYFFRDNNSNGILDPAEINYGNGFLAWGNADTMGAAFNLNLLAHDYGAYVHNSLYTKRLLYDSIDFIDDGLLNYSVGSSIGTGSALTFLNGGLVSNGNPAERP